jgi:hypothetical protein
VPDVGDGAKVAQSLALKNVFNRVASNPVFLIFDYSFTEGNPFTWPGLLAKSDILLDKLLQHLRHYTVSTSQLAASALYQLIWRQVNECPLLFLSFGLGGVIAKEVSYCDCDLIFMTRLISIGFADRVQTKRFVQRYIAYAVRSRFHLYSTSYRRQQEPLEVHCTNSKNKIEIR